VFATATSELEKPYMSIQENHMSYVHRHFKLIAEKLFLFNLNYTIAEDAKSVKFSHIGVHAIDDDSKATPCINADPHIITESMCTDAMKILIIDKVIVPV